MSPPFQTSDFWNFLKILIPSVHTTIVFLLIVVLMLFFWENKPMTKDFMDDDYECNLIKSKFLSGVSPDSQTFSQHFVENKNVVTFPNLANDALLIVPCPKKEKPDYPHIGSFVRKASLDQINDFWKITAQKTLDAIGSEPRWLSTSGLGVYWLHGRIDSIPKYYQTKEYKTVK